VPFPVLFDNLPDGVWIADTDGQIVYMNPAATLLLGLPQGAPVEAAAAEQALLRDRAGQELPPEERPLARALRGESGSGLDLVLARPSRGDGEDLHLGVSFAPLRTEDGTIAGAIVYASDRTVQHRIERTRDDFLASVSHDLRSPLTAIRGSAQLALRWAQRQLPEEQGQLLHRSLGTIDAAAARLNRMLETLLDSARLERGGLAPQCVPTDLVSLAREVLEHYEREARRHRFLLDAPAEPLVGTWDPALLERALENLVGNAVKYSPNGGEVAVGCGAEGDWVRFSVRDQGVGIPESALPFIFNQFYRAKNTRFGEIEGNGLGLFAVQGIVAAHGGTIDARSVEGEGTEMTVRLPREPDGCAQ
jgi:signal transduction histidine kinase